jgi:hypothetical protein
MADAAGFENPADTTVVSEGIINALEAGDFHLFPDEMGKLKKLIKVSPIML